MDEKTVDAKAEKTVPLGALEDERKKRQVLDTKVAELQGRIEELSVRSQPAKEEPKDLSAAQLREHVDSGKISETEADEIREKQIERRLESKITAKVETRTRAAEVSQRVAAEIDRYEIAIPDIADTNSEAHKRLDKEFQYLVGLGNDAKDLRIQLQAARTAFGDISEIETAGKARPRETYRETGGHEEPGSGGGGSGAGWPKDMPAKNRTYYEHLINQGVYADVAAVKKQWAYEPKHRPNRTKAA